MEVKNKTARIQNLRSRFPSDSEKMDLRIDSFICVSNTPWSRNLCIVGCPRLICQAGLAKNLVEGLQSKSARFAGAAMTQRSPFRHARFLPWNCAPIRCAANCHVLRASCRVWPLVPWLYLLSFLYLAQPVYSQVRIFNPASFLFLCGNCQFAKFIVIYYILCVIYCMLFIYMYACMYVCLYRTDWTFVCVEPFQNMFNNWVLYSMNRRGCSMHCFSGSIPQDACGSLAFQSEYFMYSNIKPAAARAWCLLLGTMLQTSGLPFKAKRRARPKQWFSKIHDND